MAKERISHLYYATISILRVVNIFDLIPELMIINYLLNYLSQSVIRFDGIFC